MDPNAALSRIADALDHDDQEEAREAAAALRGWLAAGGFAPKWNRYKKAAAWFKARQHNPDHDAEEQAIAERERNSGPRPRNVAWALGEVWGDLTHDQGSALLAALRSKDEGTIIRIRDAYRKAGHKGIEGSAPEAFAIMVEETR